MIPQGFQQTFRELFVSSCEADSKSMSSTLLTPSDVESYFHRFDLGTVYAAFYVENELAVPYEPVVMRSIAHRVLADFLNLIFVGIGGLRKASDVFSLVASPFQFVSSILSLQVTRAAVCR